MATSSLSATSRLTSTFTSQRDRRSGTTIERPSMTIRITSRTLSIKISTSECRQICTLPVTKSTAAAPRVNSLSCHSATSRANVTQPRSKVGRSFACSTPRPAHTCLRMIRISRMTALLKYSYGITKARVMTLKAPRQTHSLSWRSSKKEKIQTWVNMQSTQETSRTQYQPPTEECSFDFAILTQAA